MKKIFLILPLLLIVGCSKPVNEETLIDKDGLKYHPDTKELYTGKAFKNRLGGMKNLRVLIRMGKKMDYGLFGIWMEISIGKKLTKMGNTMVNGPPGTKMDRSGLKELTRMGKWLIKKNFDLL